MQMGGAGVMVSGIPATLFVQIHIAISLVAMIVALLAIGVTNRHAARSVSAVRAHRATGVRPNAAHLSDS
jgi:uncharacterized membrane protein